MAVVGACGGVGATTLAALLAVGRGPTTLVDLAPTAGGLDVALGIETTAGPRWPDLGPATGPGLLDRLPRWRGVRVLSVDRSGSGPDADTLAATWETLLAGGGRVVVDLPATALPGRADLLVGAEVVLLVGQDVRGVAGAIVARGLLGGGPEHLVLRERRRARVAPAEIEAALGARVVARLPTARAVADAADAGLGPVCPARSRLGRAVAALARRVGV